MAVATEPDLQTLKRVEQRVLWLATSIVHHANRVRENRSGVKVGGHQASSASMVSLMTALYFGVLEAPDRVSVKPHASPVLHARAVLPDPVRVVDDAGGQPQHALLDALERLEVELGGHRHVREVIR